MAFIAQRAEKIREEITLGDETIHINLNASDIALDFNNKYHLLLKARDDLAVLKGKEPSPDDLGKYGECIIALFRVIFGDENLDKVLKFYEGNYIEMLEMLFPFLIEKIYPAMQIALKQVRVNTAAKNKAAMFGLNRAQRRELGIK